MGVTNSISNDGLRLSDVPLPSADWDAISQFALTFDGYRVHGSFEKCAAIANERRRDTLTEIRTCLFFEQRSWRHSGEVPDGEAMAYIRSLVVQLREMLGDGAPGRGYIPATEVTAPKRRWSLTRVLDDPGQPGSCVLALGLWDGRPVLAMRWNGDEDAPVGNPQSRGLPTWFIVPERYNDALIATLPTKTRIAAQELLVARA